MTFEEAQLAFYDPEALLIGDPDHSDDEARFVLMGLDSRLRCLVVCHVYDDEEDVVRIISARKASRQERRSYEGRRT